MDSEPVRREPEKGNDDLLREIREDYQYAREYWAEQHNQMRTDLTFVAGDPWDKDARKEREDNNRPTLSPDELDQFLNQAINNLRQNKRAIKVNPKDDNASDENAEIRAGIIRDIEYGSDAQAAYTNAFENAINCGMGFFGITTEIVSDDDEVHPRIRMIENPLSVLPDPNCKKADFSDQKRCFVTDIMRDSDFKRAYPNAEKRSFTAEETADAPGWFVDGTVLIAEAWRIEGYDPKTGKGGKVIQYITNGIEILEKNDWPGSWIPVVVSTGKKVFVPSGSGLKKQFYSMIHKARGPQRLLAYIVSQEAEEFGMAPRAPFVGYAGQFEGFEDEWSTVNKVPRGFLQVRPMVDEATGSILPIPSRPQFSPNAQAYEIAKESARRSIQASMGISPLPTPAQRQNEKSGIALEKIQTQQSIGAFHFTDNWDRALENAGRQLNELITKVLDTPREVGIRTPDDSHALMKIQPDSAPQMPGQQPAFDPKAGQFDVTISTGPSYQSQREAASDFVDLLIQELNELPLQGPQKATLLAMAVKMKDLGPKGDELAKIIDPNGDGEPIPPQAQQMIAQLQQQVQQLTQMSQELTSKNLELEFDQKANVTKNQGQFAIEKMKIEANLAEAEINTKSQNLSERMQFVGDLLQQLIDHHHEAAMQATQAGQQQQLVAQQAQHASDQSAQDAGQNQDAQVTQAALQPPQDSGSTT